MGASLALAGFWPMRITGTFLALVCFEQFCLTALSFHDYALSVRQASNHPDSAMGNEDFDDEKISFWRARGSWSGRAELCPRHGADSGANTNTEFR